MGQHYDYSLTTRDVADHYDLSARTVRDHLVQGNLRGVKINRDWRCRWSDVWAAEQGPTPRGDRAQAYRAPLLSKKALGARWRVSERTVERWIDRGLPTRNVFGSVRIAPIDAEEWLERKFGVDEPTGSDSKTLEDISDHMGRRSVAKAADKRSGRHGP
ncbi:MAG: helix-turn-helix domain-containing protein [Limimaricola soesokkakensis]|uniref:helix-turn-helix domain-containing protein n=1 Tax=Limimaricola soesokkakensis TaxID=1343159 RepID=UPI00405A2A96